MIRALHETGQSTLEPWKTHKTSMKQFQRVGPNEGRKEVRCPEGTAVDMALLATGVIVFQVLCSLTFCRA